jgi:hypothetical protein
VDVIFEVTLWYSPATLPVTFTEKVQETFVAGDTIERVAPLRLMVEVPATAVMVWFEIEPFALQTGEVRPLGLAMSSPLGRVSVKPTPVKLLELGLVTVKVSVLGLGGMEVGEKALESVGGLGRGQPEMVTLSRYK